MAAGRRAGPAGDPGAGISSGLTFSIAVEFDRPVQISLIEDALSGEHIDLVLEDTDSPSNLAATGQNDVLVRLRTEKGGRNPNEASRIWLWAAVDNLRLHAQKRKWVLRLDLRSDFVPKAKCNS